jgi:hypothetical protein
MKTGFMDGNPCPASLPMGQVGLLWVGEKFYPTPADFNREAAEMGISHRITAIPKDFKLGKTWVFLSHRKAISLRIEAEDGTKEEKHYPDIFRIFKPQAVEYVVKGDETPEQLQKLIDWGITPVKVVSITEDSAAA